MTSLKEMTLKQRLSWFLALNAGDDGDDLLTFGDLQEYRDFDDVEANAGDDDEVWPPALTRCFYSFRRICLLFSINQKLS